LDEYTQENIERIYNSYSENKPAKWAIEQYIPAQYFLEKGYKIKELNEFDNHHIRGHAGYIRIYNSKNIENIANFRIKDVDVKKSLTKYMQENIGHHLWFSKDVDGMAEMLIYVIGEMYPDASEKVNYILEKNSLNNTDDIKSKRLI
jgi:hypothetical protein